MDRRTARRDMANGLFLGLLAALLFALACVAATIYIAAA
jgi:hypothetical protein